MVPGIGGDGGDGDGDGDTSLTTASSTSPSTATAASPASGGGCYYRGLVVPDGDNVDSDDPCEHCYCMGGEIVCAVDSCIERLQGESDDCVPNTPPPGQCCPTSFSCSGLQHILLYYWFLVMPDTRYFIVSTFFYF